MSKEVLSQTMLWLSPIKKYFKLGDKACTYIYKNKVGNLHRISILLSEHMGRLLSCFNSFGEWSINWDENEKLHLKQRCLCFHLSLSGIEGFSNGYLINNEWVGIQNLVAFVQVLIKLLCQDHHKSVNGRVKVKIVTFNLLLSCKPFQFFQQFRNCLSILILILVIF